jgi:hypothetical protein
MEKAMTSHRPAHKRQTSIRGLNSNRGTIRASIGLAVVLIAVFAVGMTIGYQSVYRNIAVAVLATDAQSPPRL